MQDVEIIAIDPNSFYTSDVSTVSSESSDSSESEEEDDVDDDDDDQEMHVSTNTPFSLAPFGMHPTNDFDIITLNIEDDFIDPQTDDILFKNDHQFDLASYIGGDSTSLLLSPVNDVASNRRRLMSLSDFSHVEPNELNSSRYPKQAAHDTVAKNPANNRRKRKNLSREFIESSDSETDNETCVTTNSISSDLVDNKRNKLVKLRKDDDPVWSPCVEKKRNGKAQKQPAMLRAKELVEATALDEEKKNAKTGLSVQGNSLRNMLKQQMLSDRPANKTKLMKTISPRVSFPEKLNTPTAIQSSAKRIGVGRGKDIEITAKYYNCNETSDNSDRDTNPKKDRFHQIYTDSDDSDIEVNIKPEASTKVVVEKKLNPIIDLITEAEIEVVKKEKSRDHNRQKPSNSGKNVEKKSVHRENKLNVNAKTSVNNNKPMHIDSSSMDSTDFAKALATNAKIVSKKASTSISMKKNNLEQQKRLIQSTLLLQNPNKFRIFATDKCKETLKSSSEISVNQRSTNGMNTANVNVNINAGLKSEPIKIGRDALPSNVGKEQFQKELKTCDQQIKSETEENVNFLAPEVLDDIKSDVVIVEETKTESIAKRKLNVQEYLKRKSLKTCVNNGTGSKDDLLANIKIEKPEMASSGQTKGNNATNDNTNEPVCSNNWIENSMYEEIIIVSMGCNTDISIPNFIQPPEKKDIKSVKSTVLLSDIQTTVEKANSKISSCSLISSIQDVILKKSQNCVEQSTNTANANGDADTTNGKEKSDEVPEHGENKVIMHLRKDRVRPLRATTSIQTDPYFQFPPLEKLTPLSKKQSTSSYEKRNGSISRDNRSSEVRHLHGDSQTRTHRNYRGPSHLSESSYYSGDDDDKSMKRRSRHSDFMERKTEHGRRTRRESSRFSSSKYDRYLSRHRTISRSLSTSSDNSNTSTDSSTTTQSSSSSSTYVSSTSARSLNSYGGSSSKSHYGDDHQYYRKRTTSNNSRRSNYRTASSKRNKSPGLHDENVTNQFLFN